MKRVMIPPKDMSSEALAGALMRGSSPTRRKKKMCELDQFFTERSCAVECWRSFRNLGLAGDEDFYIEPSAGDGAFLELLPESRRVGVDLDPQHPEISKRDFLKWRSNTRPEETVVIGNPPFGIRGNVALDFLVKSCRIAHSVAFILPRCFRKYALQRHVPSNMRLVMETSLPGDAFRLPSGKPYRVNCVFQVWTSKSNLRQDLRQTEPEPKEHPDFEMFQYNNTPQALKHFERDFDFAVPCQGWQDYTRRESDPDACERNKQWMLLKARSAKSLKRLHNIDYEKLAYSTGTSVPGFRKCDLVSAYEGIRHA